MFGVCDLSFSLLRARFICQLFASESISMSVFLWGSDTGVCLSLSLRLSVCENHGILSNTHTNSHSYPRKTPPNPSPPPLLPALTSTGKYDSASKKWNVVSHEGGDRKEKKGGQPEGDKEVFKGGPPPSLFVQFGV